MIDDLEPGIYRHYSGDHYCVLSTAIDRHGPDPERVLVVYIAPRGSYEVREINDFLSFVTDGAESNVRRFVKVASRHDRPYEHREDDNGSAGAERTGLCVCGKDWPCSGDDR